MMKNKSGRYQLLAITFFLLTAMVSACAPSTAQIQTAIAETQAAAPTNTPDATPTFVQLSAITIDPNIIQPEDLGLIGGEMLDSHPDIWPLRGLSNGNNHLSRKLIFNGSDAFGWVSIFVFESQDELSKMFSVASSNVSKYKKDSDPIGESAIAYEEALKGVIFSNCHLLVSVAYSQRDSERKDISAIVFYAKSLNKRLEPLFCR